jgi:NitT/TauT family transport system permease protein
MSTKPPEERSTVAHRVRVIAGYVVGIAGGAIAWQIGGSHAPQNAFTSLSATIMGSTTPAQEAASGKPDPAPGLIDIIADGSLGKAMWASFQTYFVGIVIAIVLGALIGILFARKRLVGMAFEPYIMAIYAIPMVGVIPFLIAFGHGFWPKVLVIVLFAFFPVVLNTKRGAASISPQLLDVARVYHTSEWGVWRHVLIPFTLPFLMTGVRQALARGLVGMIAADYLLVSNGLGGLLMTAATIYHTSVILAMTLVIAIIGLVLMGLGSLLERRFAHWRVA